jgi:hypothetical protein
MFSAPSLPGTLQTLQQACDTCAGVVEHVPVDGTPQSHGATGDSEVYTPRLPRGSESVWSPCAMTAHTGGSDVASRVGNWKSHKAQEWPVFSGNCAESTGCVLDEQISKPMAPGCMTTAAVAALRANLIAHGAVAPEAAAAVVTHASAMLAQAAVLADRTLSASADAVARCAATATDAEAVRAALRQEWDAVAAAAAAAAEREADALKARTDLDAAMADAMTLSEALEAKEAEISRLRAQPPAAEVAQLTADRAEKAREAAEAAARAAEVQLHLVTEKAALLQERCRELENEAAAARESCDELTASAEAKDCRISEIRKALAEAQQRTEAEALAASSHSRDSSDALRAASTCPVGVWHMDIEAS